MASFDDSADPALGAACNRLAAWVEPMPGGIVIDPASMLTEEDLALILRHLHATRKGTPADAVSSTDPADRVGRASVPLTARDREGAITK
ncbi:hypothetical protein ASE95_08125 [Sphingomonas sp. Leaf231]|uniref:hypothetical protein n=1 Tax=Sphingomonas sp. Leaf231 TaxID=1736301 RepID=UPI0006F20B0F|nr:hypothetical protein [Sphingomonas sp. Leaf231]KQN92642.1 hypothetical protein ASE95_08125 [Sphingomonas sp. Leaf231]